MFEELAYAVCIFVFISKLVIRGLPLINYGVSYLFVFICKALQSLVPVVLCLESVSNIVLQNPTRWQLGVGEDATGSPPEFISRY